jgi:hypothetical protein
MRQANIHQSETILGWFQCNECGKEWEPFTQYGGKYLNDWWLCPNKCNADAGKLRVLSCTRCHYEWGSRGLMLPKVCPNCNSPYWGMEKWKMSGNFKKKSIQQQLFNE